MDPHSYHYHDYSQPDPPHQPLYLDIIRRHLAADPSIKTILDAGCGDGNFTASLSELGYRMHGVDLSKGGIAAAQKAWPGIEFAEASVYDDFRMVFPTVGSFDAIIAIEVIEHLYLPKVFVRRAYEALRPGGMLIVTTPYWGYFKNILLAVTDRIDRALTALWDGGHIKHWSYRTLRMLLEQHGFEYVAFNGAGRVIPYLWKGMVMVVRKPLAQNAGSQG
jgi:2-polyprenyl-3-methyl-5-hydroxy-6-metoxy-1,4-benzoquinol methylase